MTDHADRLSAGRPRSRRRAAAGLLRSDHRPALYPRLRADPAPQRRRRRPPGRPAAHQLPHRRRHARRSQRRPGRTTCTISSAQTNFAADLYRTTSRSPASTRAIDVIDNPQHAGRRSGLPLGRSTAPIRPACPTTSSPRARSLRRRLTYLQTPGFQRGTNQQTVASASLTGDLGNWGMQFPWAETGVGVALGVEYRKESLELLTDAAFSTAAVERSRRPGRADAAGRRRASTSARPSPRSASRSSRTASSTISRSRPAIATRITASAAAASAPTPTRSASTSRSSGTSASAPPTTARSARRTSRSCSLRSASCSNGNGDPCSGAAPTAALAALSGAGRLGAQFGTIVAGNPAGQYNGLIGGIPNLDPEIADTYTAGVVLQPSFIPRLAITVDWFDIKIDAADPADRPGRDPRHLRRITPTTAGRLLRPRPSRLLRARCGGPRDGFVRDTVINIGSFATRGIDVGVSYSMRLGGLGGLSFSLVGTWLDELEHRQRRFRSPMIAPATTARPAAFPSPEWRAQVPPQLHASERHRPLGAVALLLGAVERREHGSSAARSLQPARSRPFNDDGSRRRATSI